MPDIDYTVQFRYVIYDEDGNLTGCYIQIPPAVHIGNLFPVDDSFIWTWTMYRMNQARDGVELIPPPVDPDPEEPA